MGARSPGPWPLLDGRRAVVTGGANGIGAAIVRELAAAGASPGAVLDLEPSLGHGGAPGGLIITTIVGIVGALLGGFLARALDLGDPIDEFFDVSTWVAAIVGSVILLAIFQAVAGRNSRRGAL